MAATPCISHPYNFLTSRCAFSQSHSVITFSTTTSTTLKPRKYQIRITGDASAETTATDTQETSVELPKGPLSLISALNVDRALRGIPITDVDYYGSLGIQKGCFFDECVHGCAFALPNKWYQRAMAGDSRRQSMWQSQQLMLEMKSKSSSRGSGVCLHRWRPNEALGNCNRRGEHNGSTRINAWRGGAISIRKVAWFAGHPDEWVWASQCGDAGHVGLSVVGSMTVESTSPRILVVAWFTRGSHTKVEIVGMVGIPNVWLKFQ
ncbi:chaperone DnaJ-domain superfamily protein [Actinidia rufa]|uniref:Chaperone DnaJ-domain superfamily protein n=1 Tax=Actinidia rufa TaxID=165716 RepID=A0A7J0DNU6_9ERIC|nr:chaperone DnaJ-domain superfamily protein [Actinidia rufa]